MEEISALSLFRYFSLAGVLKNRSFTLNIVPSIDKASLLTRGEEGVEMINTPGSFFKEVKSSTLLTAAIEGIASPLKPKVLI